MGTSRASLLLTRFFFVLLSNLQLLGMGSHHFESAIEVETGGAAHGSNLTELLDQKEQNKGQYFLRFSSTVLDRLTY